MINPNENFSGNSRSNARAKKIAAIITASVAASLATISTATIVSTIIAYDSFFPRYERPDYSVYPGMYYYARFDGSLPRKRLTVDSDGVKLAAYYYPVSDPKGLVVVVHGIHAGADDYLPLIEAMVNGGYAVFAYDATGNYSSGGKDGVGMCQQLKDLDNVLNFLAKSKYFANMPKLLIGHSWGGYAAASVLALHSEVKACVCIAPMCNGYTIMVEKAEEYAGKMVVQPVKPIFDAYQNYLFGDYTKYDSIKGINSSSAHILIAQGVDDTVITPDGLSITAHLDEITNPNVTLYYGRGAQGSHTGIWHSTEAEEYAQSVKDHIKHLEESAGRELTNEEKAEYYKTVDHRLYSDVNPELIDLIFETFEKALHS